MEFRVPGLHVENHFLPHLPISAMVPPSGLLPSPPTGLLCPVLVFVLTAWAAASQVLPSFPFCCDLVLHCCAFSSSLDVSASPARGLVVS